MALQMLTAVVVLSVCGLRLVESAPRWTSTPYNDKKVYQINGGSYTFLWRYNDNGSPIDNIQWFKTTMSNDNPPKEIHKAIGRRDSSGKTTIAPDFQGRVTFTSGASEAGFQIRQLKAEDNVKFTCQLSFQNFDILSDSAELVVVVPPVITNKLTAPKTINEGQTFINLPCAATGNPKPKIRWLRNGIEIQSLFNHFGYNITDAGKKDKGLYRCEAIVAGGSIVRTSSYEVNIIVRYKPEVTFVTRNQSWTENIDVEIECTAVGEPPVTKYHWYKGKGTSPEFKISDGGKYVFTSNKMKIMSLKKDDSSWYTCAAENDVGIGQGKSTYVTTLYPPKLVTVVFKPSNPINISEVVKVICESDGMPLPTYTWKFNGVTISGSGERGKEIVRSSITKEQAGNYSCLARNAHGSKEDTKILYTRYKPTQTIFSTGKPNIGAIMGSKATLTCKADGYPPPQYILKKDGVVLSGNEGTYLFTSVKLVDENLKFSCTPYNMMGQGPEIEGKITVLVTPSFISSLPTTKQVRAENETKNYTCVADAKPAAQMLWTINKENVTENTTYLGSVFTVSTVSPSNNKYQRTESTLILNPVNWRMAGNISCIAYNDAGQRKQTTILEVKHRPVVMLPKDHPQNSTLNAGQTVTFTCKATGNPPTLRYVWRFKDAIISSESSSTFSKENIVKDDEGRYSCSGVNNRGEGPQAYAYLFIKTPAKIYYAPQSVANVTGLAVLECRANGVPKPNITWTRKGDVKILHKGEKYSIVNVTYEDAGKYICSAKNELNIDKQEVTLLVQVKPNITSNKPMDTQIAGEIGEDTSIRCVVKAIPYATIWWTRGSDSAMLNARSDRVKSLNIGDSEMTIIITVSYFGEKYYCHAKNILGYVTQQFTIRKKGPPDAPLELNVEGIRVPKKRTVDVNLTWTPGYAGGEQQFFTVLYKLNSVEAKVFTEIEIDNAAGAQCTIKDLKPYTGYVFKVRPKNSKGLGKESEPVYYTTPASVVPPARGTVSVTRLEDGTQFEITWTMNENVTHTYLQYREVEVRARREEVRWNNVVGAQGLPRNVTKFLVVNLNADKTYQFRLLFKVADESGFNDAMVVESDTIYPVIKPAETTGLREDELIAIIAACAGVLLILIVVLCLCCCRRRKKPYGADSIQMSQAASGPNLFSYGDNEDNNRRSYATESIEDDPFIEAHIANEMKKKKRPSENGINHGYASQGSMRQPEILLNPGSRPGMRGISQSQPQLDARGSYSSSGPQRDFATLPAYHEPPTFEEAVRQSVKKSKHAQSTGDLTGTRGGPPYIRSRPMSPDSDSTSDGEPLNRHPMFKVRPIAEATDHRYTSAPALQSPIESPTRRPPAVYARPQKKVYDGYPVDMFNSPEWDFMDQGDQYHEAETGWPPPRYTPADRAIPGMEDGYEPRVNKRRPITGDILELDDYPYGRDNLPDLPPRMPELSNSRGQMYKEPIGETLPEPPSFLRDVGYEDDDDEIDSGPYHPRSFTEPRNRGRQPYVNMHGQVVRPGSPVREPAYGTERREPIYANDPPRLVAPEPEVPVNQRRNRAPSADSSEADHKPGYVSSGFLV